MPDLLLEFFSEEIPARMQARAAEDLKKLVTDKLVAAGLTYDGAKAFATPRRLALAVAGIPVRQPDVKDERKGPKVGAPEQAIAGFLRAAGLTSIGQAKVQPDKKGDFYVAVIDKPGRPAIEVIAGLVPEVAKAFPWPKAMRWGEASAKPGALNWVRPLHSIVAMFGPETEEPDVVPFEVGGVVAGDTTFGHRFMAPAPIKVKRLDDYMAKLGAAKVVVDPARRAQMILTDAKTLAFVQGFELVEDEGLLAEVAGLVEWPVVMMGSFDKEFLAIPEEVIRATIRNNQKCFVVRDPATAKLTNKFVMVANIEASDGGKAIVAGCERVIRARLSDAKFFYDTDLKTRLEDRLPKFEHIVFHEKLGTQAERIARIVALAGHLAPLVGADKTKADRAAQLCKADLATEVVGEFPEVQGLMGRYYAEAQGEDEAVAHAIEDHYKPKGPDDLVPSDPVSVAVALADKIDILTGFWAIDEKPTGSKDPYALRRAALGVTRILLNNNIRISLSRVIADFLMLVNSAAELDRIADAAFVDTTHELTEDDLQRVTSIERSPFFFFVFSQHFGRAQAWEQTKRRWKTSDDSEIRRHVLITLSNLFFEMLSVWRAVQQSSFTDEWKTDTLGITFADKVYEELQQQLLRTSEDILSFFADRLKVQLREQGARHDLVDAVFALPGQDDLVLVVRRIEALGKFLDTDDGKNLLAGTKRAANILRIEEKKDNTSYTGAPDAALLNQPEEKELACAIGVAKSEADAAVAREDFASAMTAMSKLRPHVDAFFDKVTVNVDDKALRANRLRLLNEIREATRAVADFSKIEGG